MRSPTITTKVGDMVVDSSWVIQLGQVLDLEKNASRAYEISVHLKYLEP